MKTSSFHESTGRLDLVQIKYNGMFNYHGKLGGQTFICIRVAAEKSARKRAGLTQHRNLPNRHDWRRILYK
jgi:hypothetical protein